MQHQIRKRVVAAVLALGFARLCLSGEKLTFSSPDQGRHHAVQSRRAASLVGVVASPWVLSSVADADVLRLKRAPLPKAYSESVTATAKALKEAFEAEEAAGTGYITQTQEANLANLEQKAGQLVQSYGERYISEDGLSPGDPLRKNQVHYEMEEVISSFEVAVKSDKLNKYRKDLIDRLANVLDLADKSGIQ
mmetsp:Transcript_9419/g.22657  ORF Transcript_9419/g.22657 Transcript_9419/m.22657 type:complete len:193 (-) Transcript_9419:58-636(-)